MTFEEWALLLELREKLVPDVKEIDRVPWRCTGACGQLMYGVERIDGRNYPVAEGTPAGLFISKSCPHVCHVCWDMYHAIPENAYWYAVEQMEQKQRKRLSPGSDYLAM